MEEQQTKHGLATEKYLSEQEKEQQELDRINNRIDSGISSLPENTEDTKAGTEVRLPEKWLTETSAYVSTEDGKQVKESKKVASVYAVSTGNGEIVPIPNGFYYVGGRINEGVVISDNAEDRYEEGVDKTTHEYATKLKGNQFVWIPCKLEEYKKINWRKGKRKMGYGNKSIRI